MPELIYGLLKHHYTYLFAWVSTTMKEKPEHLLWKPCTIMKKQNVRREKLNKRSNNCALWYWVKEQTTSLNNLCTCLVSLSLFFYFCLPFKPQISTHKFLRLISIHFPRECLKKGQSIFPLVINLERFSYDLEMKTRKTKQKKKTNERK